jgi:molybdopterin converting factor subunit 1
MSQVSVLFFASLKDLTGLRQVAMELPDGASVLDLKVELQDRFPSLVPALKTVLVAVNREYASDDDSIPLGAEVALFPPVSGGYLIASAPPSYPIFS